ESTNSQKAFNYFLMSTFPKRLYNHIFVGRQGSNQVFSMPVAGKTRVENLLFFILEALKLKIFLYFI
ncbi:hypothetical protein, partial [Microcystis sp. T1-4]|uniref:hypothetical protein n=1 Tax=Microcystis sp. T1-4 TaxID=1160279 RepID=UPI001E5BF887